MICIAIVCLLLIGALLYREKQHATHLLEREKAWDIERTNLLNRIQRPDAMPLPLRPDPVADDDLREQEVDEIDLVGTIQINGEYNAD